MKWRLIAHENDGVRVFRLWTSARHCILTDINERIHDLLLQAGETDESQIDLESASLKSLFEAKEKLRWLVRDEEFELMSDGFAYQLDRIN